jgi:hypothetical protein
MQKIKQLIMKKKTHPFNHIGFTQLQKQQSQKNFKLWQEAFISSFISLAIALLFGFFLQQWLLNRLSLNRLITSPNTILNDDKNQLEFNQSLLQCLHDLNTKNNEAINNKPETALCDSKTMLEDTPIEFNWYQNSAGKRVVFNTETQQWQIQ